MQIRIQFITLMRIRILPLSLMWIHVDPDPVAEQCEHFSSAILPLPISEHYTLQCLGKFGVGRRDDLTLDLYYVRSDRVSGLIIFFVVRIMY